jgi:hypothetical protein
MACRCKKHQIGATASADPLEPVADYNTLPDEPCDICAEKHFSEAFRLAFERGYETPNRQIIIGELLLAVRHCYRPHRELAEKLRELRHQIQLRREPPHQEWVSVCADFEKILAFKIEQHLCSGETFPDYNGNVWIISNCEYPSNRMVPAGPDDILVFINKAKSLPFYLAHKRKVVFHRSPEPDYGNEADKSVEHFYCFRGKDRDVPRIPEATIKTVKNSYDWNYEIEAGKVKSTTTGYMVVCHLEKVLPNAKIKLVNFGYKVEKSSYRCPWHNWKFEAEKLAKFPHIYTAEVNNE